MKLNDCFLGKTSLVKNLKMFLGGGGGWGTHPCYKACVPQVIKTKNMACESKNYLESVLLILRLI